jgi:protein-L-isoaspartate(D-aspartate) O-methyltransferase
MILMPFDFAAARSNMVDGQVRTSDVTDLKLIEAFRNVARETLCPPEKAAFAYADVEIAYAPGRWLMRPREVAKLLQALDPQPGGRALAIAAPYAAAVLQAMGLTVERMEDGDLRAPPGKDYDIIVCESAVERAPEAWISALAPGGRLGVVERRGPVGKARLYLQSEQGVAAREVFDASPHYLAGFEPQPGFAF